MRWGLERIIKCFATSAEKMLGIAVVKIWMQGLRSFQRMDTLFIENACSVESTMHAANAASLSGGQAGIKI